MFSMEHVLHKLNIKDVVCSRSSGAVKNNSRNKKISTKNIRKTKF